MEVIQKEFRSDPNDDRPLAKGKKNFDFSEYPEGEGPPQVDLSASEEKII